MSRRKGTSCCPPLRISGSCRGTAPTASLEREPGLLEHGLHRLQELGCGRPVDGAMVDRQRRGEHRPHDDGAVAHDRALLDRADGEDRGLRRVEHGDEALDPVHAQVGDGERPALEVGLLQLPVPCLVDDSRPQPWTTGTTSPCGAATASATLALGWRTIASSAKEAFTCGCRLSAEALT